MKNNPLKLIAAAAISGGLVALTYRIFTVAVEHAQDFLWFDIGKTDENKIMALPLAIIGGLAMAGILHLTKVRGFQEIGHTIPQLMGAKSVTPLWVARSIVIGFVSLVAGASLGPEAVLIPVAFGIGFLIAKSFKVDTATIGLMGIIALLAAFFNAFAAGLVPLGFALASKKKDAKTIISALVVGLIATGASIGILRLLDDTEGYVELSNFGDISFNVLMIVTAVIIAAVSTLLPFLLEKVADSFKKVFSLVSKRWYVQGAVAGLGVGCMYALLGPIGFFSGHTGLTELLANNSEYTSLQLAGLAIGKLIVTAWSVATIYRGGLVFPQLIIAMSLALLFTGGIPDNAWLVTLLASSFFGVFTGALGSLFIAAAFVFPLFGFAVLPVVLAAAVGSMIVKYALRKYFATANAV